MSRTVVLAVLLGMALSPAPAAAADEVREVSAAAKKKPKKCKKGKVRERGKVGKRTRTRCVKAKKAWPAPKAVDMRAESTGYVLGGSYAKLRDRRGRKAKSLPKLLKRIHPRAERSLERAAKAGLARMDARARTSQAGGCGGPSATVSGTFDAGGGQSVDMTMTGGPEASLQLGLENSSGNRKVRVEIEFPGCESHDFEACPGADGILRGKDNRRISVRAIVTEGGTVTWSQGIKLDGETTFRGVVQDDAKLDFFEPHNTEVGTLTLGGSSRGFSPLSIRMLVQRITRVDYPGKSYSLGPSTVNATISSPDLSGAALTAAERTIEAGMRSQADQQFRDIIAKAITRFDGAETHWNGANNCAAIDFTPASGSRTLRVGDTGTVSANLRAQRGGSPPSATWTHLGASNGAFTPGAASSVPASFSYAGITQAGPGILVVGTWKAVSRAGVAQGTWTQPTETSGVSTIAGSFGGTYAISGAHFAWNGAVTFVRALPQVGSNGAFQAASGDYTVVASGRDTSTGCRQAGSETVPAVSGHLQSVGRPPDFLAPYDYNAELIGVGVDAMSMKVTLSECPEGYEDLNGDTIDVGLPFNALKGSGTSGDGILYAGIAHNAQSPVTETWHWNLTGR